VSDVETDRFLAEKTEKTPEEIFDRQWARDVLLESIADLRRILDGRGEGRVPQGVRVLRAGARAGDRTYGSIARDLGLSEHQVKNHLDAARERLEQIVRERLARGVSSARELTDEMNELFTG
jgi:hypothetical protein